MSKINKQALREEFQYMQEHYSDPADHDRQVIYIAAEAMLDELEAAQRYAKERDEENQDLMLTVGRLRVERETSEAEMGNALCELLPGVQYMDPPDGGNVTPLEQVRRMVADYRERIAELETRELVAAGIITKVGE
ncbi:ead/Ea22-like family protein [Leclercia adecarboxylata]|uniref:ead/Ea22-like family protein n=1 Tax=Leclercia adecarboxylata TaxID=83655 RepID=UPI002DBC433A|nr:ead/Ea22-like family protein [Leclercia adecarboxylata]MEC3905143.1 ead/Ea22-like family protein [Leclercia adecarboxylata]